MRSPVAHLAPIIVVFAQKHRRQMMLGGLMAGLTVLSGMALLGVSGWFITASAIAGLSAGSAIVFDVFSPSAGIRLLAIGRTAARYGERMATHEAALRVIALLRERLFRGWAEPNAAAALTRQPAKLLFRLTSDLDALDSLYLRVLVPGVVSVLAALSAGILFGVMTPLLGLAVCLFLLAAGLGIPFAAGRTALAPGRRRAHAMEALRARTVDLCAGQTDLVMAGRLPAQRDLIMAADHRLTEADDALNRIETHTAFAFSLASSLLLTLTLLAMWLLASRGTIGAPLAALGLLVALAAMEPFAALRRGALEFGRTVLSAGRIAPRLKVESAGERPTNITPALGQALAIAKATVFYNGADIPALQDIDLSIAPGERVALVGASGSGKSTLLGLIAGEVATARGTIATQAATLFTQRTELFQDSLRDNLRLARADADDDRLRAVLSAAGLAELVGTLDAGLDTKLGEGGAGLSAGQSRRLALARLLLRDTPVWLLDEPTEGLDGETARAVISEIARMAEGRTLVVATHIRREAESADRIIVFVQGRISVSTRRGEPEFDALLHRLRPD